MGNPATKFSQTLGTIEEAINGRISLSELDIARIKSDINSMAKINQARAYTLEGALYAALNEVDKSIAAHNKAVKHYKSTVDDQINFGVSLLHLNFWKEGLSKFDMQIKQKQISKRQIKLLATTCMLIGDIDLALECSNMNITDNESFDVSKECEVANDFLIKESIDKTELKKICAHAETLAQKYRLNIKSCEYSVHHFHGERILNIDFNANSNAKILFEVNEILMTNIIDDNSISKWDKIVPSFEYSS